MCVKNSLMAIKYMNSAHNEVENILNVFREARKLGINEISMECFLTSSNPLQKHEIYDVIHKLIECGVVSKEEYIRCPYCFHEERIYSENDIKDKCSRCKEYYDSPIIIEKFKLKEYLYERKKTAFPI